MLKVTTQSLLTFHNITLTLILAKCRKKSGIIFHFLLSINASCQRLDWLLHTTREKRLRLLQKRKKNSTDSVCVDDDDNPINNNTSHIRGTSRKRTTQTWTTNQFLVYIIRHQYQRESHRDWSTLFPFCCKKKTKTSCARDTRMRFVVLLLFLALFCFEFTSTCYAKPSEPAIAKLPRKCTGKKEFMYDGCNFCGCEEGGDEPTWCTTTICPRYFFRHIFYLDKMKWQRNRSLK